MTNWYACPESWSLILRQYLPGLAVYSLIWEMAQLPLYTLWAEARPGQIAFAVVHCTVGDILIGMAALLLALILLRSGAPKDWPMRKVGMIAVLLAIFYTLPSERINIAMGNWSYSSWMPVLPFVEVGLSPLLQWIVVPLAALRRVEVKIQRPGS